MPKKGVNNAVWEKQKEGLEVEYVLLPEETVDDFFDFVRKSLGDAPENAALAHSIWKVGNKEASSTKGRAFAFSEYVEGHIISFRDFFKEFIEDITREEFTSSQEFKEVKRDIRVVIDRWNKEYPKEYVDMPEEPAPVQEALKNTEVKEPEKTEPVKQPVEIIAKQAQAKADHEQDHQGHNEDIQLIRRELRRRDNENAKEYEKRVYNELKKLAENGNMKDAVSRFADILLFLEQDEGEIDESHLAAENVVKRFREYLCGESDVIGAIANETELRRLRDFSEAVGEVNTEAYIRAGDAKQITRKSIMDGEIPGTEILAGIKDDRNKANSSAANEEAIRAVGDALVETTNYNFLKAGVLKKYFDGMLSEWARIGDAVVDIKDKDGKTRTLRILNLKEDFNNYRLRGKNKFIDDAAKRRSLENKTKIEYEKNEFNKGYILGSRDDFKKFPEDIEKKYGYVINKKAYLPDEKLFSKTPAAAAINNVDDLVNANKVKDEAKANLEFVEAFKEEVSKTVEELSKYYHMLDENRGIIWDGEEFRMLHSALHSLRQVEREYKVASEGYEPHNAIETMKKVKNAALKYYEEHNKWYKAHSTNGKNRLQWSYDIFRFIESRLNGRLGQIYNIMERSTLSRELEGKSIASVGVDSSSRNLVETERTYKVGIAHAKERMDLGSQPGRKEIDIKDLEKHRRTNRTQKNFKKLRMDIRTAKAANMQINVQEGKNVNQIENQINK